ncbi:hypothetical protein GU926_03105 [Nibribacter ruber]|uniref:Uncharacterized protein n=1 Tax=Nibribacter ruber TaxID=2698458 RepID=A0A6P1P0J1_9BACT|nr:hypothetical protein [Nibribacter ruber]QHL86482.1 hypothetical protein GU926_03105 [Nibribacter ruber]
MAETKDKDAIQQIYNKVLPKVAERIYQHLTEVVALFDDFRLEKVADYWTRDKDAASDKEISIENGNVAQVGLQLQLLGFQRPGVTAFDLQKDLVVKLDYTSYTVGPDRNTAWEEKPYFYDWSNQELEELAVRWSEAIIDDLIQQLQTAK